MTRPKQSDLGGIEGEGVAPVRHKDLDKFRDQLEDLQDRRASLTEKITTLEKRTLERMTELGINRYRFGEKEMLIKPGNPHVKIKQVRVGSGGSDGEADEGGEE